MFRVSIPTAIRGGVYWRLRAEGLDGAPGLDASFVVPVFVTAQSRKPEREVPRPAAGEPAAAETQPESDRPRGP